MEIEPVASRLITKRGPATHRRTNGARVHTLYDPHVNNRDVPELRRLDIVFIPSEVSSQVLSDSGYFWLRDTIAESFPDARVVFCTHGGVRENIIENLLFDLIDDRNANNRSNIPMIIMAHSFGGALAKQLFIASSPMRNSWPEANLFHSNIKGYMFFGTMHRRGTVDSTGDFGRLLGTLIPVASMFGFLPSLFDLSDPRALYDLLYGINEDFENSGGEQVPTVCFYETQPIRLAGYSFYVVPKHDATLPNAENRAIDATHVNLVRFPSPADKSLQRVLGSLGRLIPKARDWHGVAIRVPKQLQMPPDTIKVLTLDGGGVRGLFSVLVLEALMEAVKQIDDPDSSDLPRPCDYFDLICGTSTGGLLAIMLGRLRMDVRACKRAYRGLSENIFRKTVWSFPFKKWWDAYWGTPWFSGERLELACERTISDYLSAEERAMLREARIAEEQAPLCPLSEMRPRCFVCALVENGRQCHRLRSYIPTRNLPAWRYTICEAARATCTAPLYFPPAIIAGFRYFDGGMESNNPILEAIQEVNQEYPTKSISSIVSIGAGSSQPLAPAEGLRGFARSVVGRVVDAEAKHDQFLQYYPGLRDVYSRFQERDQLGSIDLADWRKLNDIERLAEEYLTSREGVSEIRRCAERLARNRGNMAVVRP